MRTKLFFIIIVFIVSAVGVNAQKTTDVWVADNGDGTYKNPILYLDYSDPDAIRVGDDYYLVASSFNCSPGLPILHSNDLVNWNILTYALPKQIPAEVYDQPQHGKGVWAPCIRFHNGLFYIYYPDPDFGIYVITAKDPAAAWSKPTLVLPGKGIIDPTPFWDEDGKAYLTIAWAASRAGVNSLLTVYKMNTDGMSVLDEGKHVFDGHDHHPTIEGPKVYKRNGYYYIFAPAGGVPTGWQLILRSKNIYGPYEEKIVMDQGATSVNGPHQGAWVDTKTGEHWFLHFQDKGAYGRIVHLQPMTWKNDWPVIGVDKNGDGKGEPVMVYKKPNVGKQYPISVLPVSDEFNSDSLGTQWQWHANEKIQWYSLLKGRGFLRLFTYPQPKDAVNLWPSSNLLLQKFPAPDYSATTKVKLQVDNEVWQNKKVGLLIMGNDYAYLSIQKNENGYSVAMIVCKDALKGGTEKVIEEKVIAGSEAYLKVNVTAPDAMCKFSFSENGLDFIEIGTAFKSLPDKWVGAKVGLFCKSNYGDKIGGYADIDWFRITK